MANEQLNQLLDDAIARHDETLAQFGGPAPVHLASGGIPFVPRAVMSGTARDELQAIKDQWDAYTPQAQAYNDALNKWKTETYEPYIAAVDKYNADAATYNAGPRTTAFAATAPTAIQDFSMAAPKAPEITQEQYQAKADAANAALKGRQMGIDAFTDPDRFNLSINSHFADGGEVGEVKEPWLPQVSTYSELTAQDMYPGQQGQYDQRDAARHMLAAGTLARKYGPTAAEMMGKAHEITTSPFRYIGSKLGISQMPVDYEQDLHNNQIGIELARRSKSQKDLEDLVQQMAEQHRTSQTQGQAWTGKPVRKRADGSPEYGEIPTGGITEDTRTTLAQPITARGALQALKDVGTDVGRGALSNAESLARGALSVVPGSIGDLEALARKGINWSFGPGGVKVSEKTYAPTSEEIRASVPRETPLRPESAGMESLGEIMSPGFAKATKGMPVGMAVRPVGGGTSFTGTVYGDKMMSKMDEMVYNGQTSGLSEVGPELKDAITKFWEGKAKNYLTRQMGTADDPIFNAILRKDIKGSRVEEHFPEDRLDAALMGKTRVNPETGEERFFPKYPNVIPALTKAYDELTGIKGVSFDKGAADARWTNILSDEARVKERLMNEQMIDKIMGQTNLPPNRINPSVHITGPKADDVESLVNSPGDRFKQLHQSYLHQQRTPNEEVVPQHLRQAIESGEPIYDIAPRGILSDVLSPDNINKYLKTLDPKQIEKMRFDDVVKNSAKYNMKLFARADLERDIRNGKRVPNSVFEEGVSKPIMQFGEDSSHPGFAWKRIEKDESTVPEGAYLGHSVGGYAPGGMYGPEKNKLFNEGKYQVYTLRDNNNRPVNTIEVRMDSENAPVVTQIKGNGRATGNTAPTDYDQLVKEFLIKQIKPVRITEFDKFLTPSLINLKNSLPGQ